jgi:hypothetical protein
MYRHFPPSHRRMSNISLAFIPHILALPCLMVKWESRADRGGRTPHKGRGQRGHRQSNPAHPIETTPPPNPPAAQKPVPKGSPISKKLARHSAHAWNTLIVPELAVQVGPYPSLMHAHTSHPLQLQTAFDVTPSRPHFGTAAAHMGLIVPRAGSSS